MALSVFEYREYRKFLSDFLSSGPRHGRGKRSDLARAIQCHGAYVSRVLNGVADLSPEQAFRVSAFLGQSLEESEFFQLLVRHERAGTPELRKYLDRQIDSMQRENLKLDHRLGGTPAIAESDRLTYYSHWYYSAIHISTAVPHLRNAEAISAYLHVPVVTVRKVLGFLASRGLVIQEKGTFRIGKTHIHADSASLGSRQHHVNWRYRGIGSLDVPAETDVHYSSVISCSRKDVPKLNKILVEAVEKMRDVIRQSGDDVVYCYLIDLFEAGQVSASS